MPNGTQLRSSLHQDLSHSATEPTVPMVSTVLETCAMVLMDLRMESQVPLANRLNPQVFPTITLTQLPEDPILLLEMDKTLLTTPLEEDLLPPTPCQCRNHSFSSTQSMISRTKSPQLRVSMSSRPNTPEATLLSIDNEKSQLK